MKRLAQLAVLCSVFAATPAVAEQLVVSLSKHRVQITSSFTGEDLVLFGTVEASRTAPARNFGYDLVVTVVGPRKNFKTRRKQRVLGIWVNVDSREFTEVPAYLAVLSNRPFDQIASAANLRRLQIGLDNQILTQRIGLDLADTVRQDPFRAAFVQLQAEYGFYREDKTAVSFLTPTVFRAGIPLPANVPIGAYSVEVMLFADGVLIERATSALNVVKSGFEQYVADAARDLGLLYGIATSMIALLIGWIASVLFRKD